MQPQKSDMNTLNSDGIALKSTLKNTAEDIKYDAKSGLANMSHSLQDNASEYLAKVEEKMTHMKDYGRHQMDRVETEVRANPAKSIAMAFGAGIIVSFLLGRRG
jgi:ElaB/YqjD/DUF883 family membrane-anchored ribosome-binding protein